MRSKKNFPARNTGIAEESQMAYPVRSVQPVRALVGLGLSVCAVSMSVIFPAASLANSKSGGSPLVPVVGQPCVPGPSRLDANGRLTGCLRTSSVGRIWVWSSPVPRNVVDLSVPSSWSGVVIDESGLSAPNQPNPIVPGYQSRADMEAALINLVNTWREGRGLALLAHDPRLSHLSKFWAERISAPEFRGRGTSHCPVTLCPIRTNEIGYMSFGEVIRPFTPAPQSDIAAERFFIDSPSHFAILMGNYTHIGFAFHPTTNSDGRAGFVVVGQTARSR